MSLLVRVWNSALIPNVGRRKAHPKFQLSNSQARRRSKDRAALSKRGVTMANQNTGSEAKAVILYHYPCPDGVFAALAAHLYHSAIGCPALFLPNTVYQPLR
jgi:hypothetical protein